MQPQLFISSICKIIDSKDTLGTHFSATQLQMVHFGALLGLNMLCGIIAVHESQISVSTSFELSTE